MWPRLDGLRTMELGMPGEQRDRLTALVLAGTKRATAGLLTDYTADGEPPEHVGERMALVDSAGTRIATVEVTAVLVTPFGRVSWEFAEAEGEGFTSVEHWRQVHAGFWSRHSGTEVGDNAPVVCVWFRLIGG
ncbi:ASCH domain-containing protein [Lentzea guizhouensis]|uniref:ASCH domain-containing protein n=1 Tax=Lentzea guizhouensis TaxID=1586287 RepID=A0A1B2HSU3_9PSEU|nr:ASCH domain-containing protein [Lentzea guizhouensis]ANZ40781.1 ASCH domain-containing protein [Lentzea guizhouensis]